MARRDYKLFVRSVFEPLTNSAGRPDLLDKLTTEPVSDDRKSKQFQKFSSFKIDQSDVVYLPNGGFAALYRDFEGQYFGLSSAGLITKDETKIFEWAASKGFVQQEFDECTFICFAHELQGYYRLADRFRAPEDALNVIDVLSEDYKGHSFSELFTYYRPVILFRIPEDSSLLMRDIFGIAAEICCGSDVLRSAIIDDELAAAIRSLIESTSVPNENLFQAVTASHFRHAFLELYRCLESIFYLPWMIELKTAGEMSIRACELKNTCRTALHWREKELPSMEKMFNLFAGNESLEALENTIDFFRDIKNSEDFNRTQLGKRLYRIRNGMVHHEDYEEPNKYKPNDVQ